MRFDVLVQVCDSKTVLMRKGLHPQSDTVFDGLRRTIPKYDVRNNLARLSR